MRTKNKNIKDINSDTWKKFKLLAMVLDISMSETLTLLLKFYIKNKGTGFEALISPSKNDTK